MEWTHWEEILKWFNPRTIIEVGGFTLLLLVVYAETGIMLGFFLPGDSLLFTAGLLASTSQFQVQLWKLLVGVSLAAIVGDNTGYWIGRFLGRSLYNKKESWYYKREYIILTRAYFQKYGKVTLIIGRFLPIVRTFAPILAGVVELPYHNYITYSLAGGLLWVNSLIPLGYFLGSRFSFIEKNLGIVVMIIVAVTTIPIIRKIWSENRKAKEKREKRKKIINPH
jgi:membrane-associated protein